MEENPKDETYHDFVDQFVNEDEVCSQILLFERSTEVVNAANDGAEQLEGEGRDDGTTC